MLNHPFQFGLGGVPFLADAKTRSICAENPDGSKGAGAQDDPRGQGAGGWLGKGWKITPCTTAKAGETLTLADISGSGVIQHIWITVAEAAYRDCILRMYWDGEETPSVEVPLGDFFCLGHSLRTKINSLPIAVNPSGGMNSYWPLPFRNGAKITVENQRWEDIGGFFYQITYAETAVPVEAAYLHAQWRRSMGTREYPEHVILDDITGKGQYVGTYLAWTQLSDGWWGEGEIKFFMDGDTDCPTICGTGTEDYLCGSYGFPETYSTAYVGNVLKHAGEDGPPKWSLYRWHIMDPICFSTDLRVTIQALGWWPNGKYQPLADDIASVAYWYQREPHVAFPEFPSLPRRWPR